MKKSVYHLIIFLIALPAGLMFGLQLATIENQYEKAKKGFKDDVKEAVKKAQIDYAIWNSHTSDENNKKSFDTLYTNEGGSFVFMIAQTVQPYPLLNFKPDTALPRLRKAQFLRFKQELEKTRNKENPHLKEFYLFRSIQYCLDCEENKTSVAKIFPLDSLIRSKLKAQKIDTDVEIAFYSPPKKQYTFLKNNADTTNFNQTEHQLDFTSSEQVRLFFPKQTRLLLYASLKYFLASIFLATFSIICFVWASKMLFKQKQLAEMKNDFINNVTHEFKTPIATVAFAIANIENEKVIHDPEAIRQFTKIIKDENKRLNSQVEKVLQAAITDKKDFGLKKEDINIHLIINGLADTYDLKIKDKGVLHRRLNASKAEIKGDHFHISNAISNLLDNAIKYTEGILELGIHTESDEKGIKISVSDNGIGINKDKHLAVFEKFYRVPTGNLHNVKGFGLGLSYVKEMVEKHKGTVTLQSKINKGSTFTIFLPFE